MCFVSTCHGGNYVVAHRALEEVFAPFDFWSKNASNVVFLAGIEYVFVGSFVGPQVRLGSGKLWISGQAEVVENALDCFLKIFVPI